jgi:LuxR family transcriptional regulator, maltose regulon positive regulatory protein
MAGSRRPSSRQSVGRRAHALFGLERRAEAGNAIEEALATLTEFASSEDVSVNTIKSQVASVPRKLGAGKRRDAVRVAMQRGFL